MLKYTDYDIVFQEIPDEVTLAINLSLCPNRCPGCHSPQLWEDLGERLDERAIDSLMVRYASSITCVCFMGGDNDPQEVIRLARYIHNKGKRTGWYSGKEHLQESHLAEEFDYVKTGPYIEALGGLNNPATNQRLYKRIGGELHDITPRMRKER